ncbi:hypothetical protein Patl1_32378 [Pistacia atlantica]|uniref:Uncharacterized protein n=1 Tax=Pistacia atlantica TaxID=434234 RepID=A0ACC1ANU3_9ROSI|nr:hypothetical protein Patl1_32378 [Pistacia atlantica]
MKLSKERSKYTTIHIFSFMHIIFCSQMNQKANAKGVAFGSRYIR